MRNPRSHEAEFIEQERAKILIEQNKYPWWDKEVYSWHKAEISSYQKKNHMVILGIKYLTVEIRNSINGIYSRMKTITIWGIKISFKYFQVI